MTKLYSGNSRIDSVLSDAGLGTPAVNSWSTQSTVGSGVTLTYDWMQGRPANAPAGGFEVFTANQRAGAQNAMALASEVANINFVRQSSGTADIEFGTLAFGGSSSGYTAGLASTTWTITGNTTYYTHADVYLTNSFPSTGNLAVGTSGFGTMVHELGHALGLDHTFENRTPPSGTDNKQYSIMSYTNHPDMNSTPSSFMLYDIAALQYLYGANTSTRTGNTTYNWARNEAMVETIWDAGGVDMIDASNQTRRAIIDLNDGAFSSIGSNGSGGNAVNNIAIAYDAIIEKARGGSGADTLYGNEFANSLYGGDGDDTLSGAAGNDYFRADDGADTINGGSGTDWASYYYSDSAVTVHLGNGTGSGGEATGDRLNSIERLTGSRDHGDKLYGTDGANLLRGYGGNDYFRGDGGADVLEGGAGTDWASYYYSNTGVTIHLGNGTGSGGEATGDVLRSIERVTGSRDYGDKLYGTDGANLLRGYGGNDYFRGDEGGDIISGGAGIDWASYYYSGSGVTIDLDAGTASGGDAQGDVLTSIERLTGSNGYGDQLTGNDADNLLRGYGGNDRLNGGLGDDSLDGGSGADTFVFEANWGDDLVKGFGASTNDVLDFTALQISRNDLAISRAGGDTIVAYNGNTITIDGFTQSLLSDDFLF